MNIKEFKLISSNKNWETKLIKTEMNETIFKIINIEKFSLNTSSINVEGGNIKRNFLLPSKIIIVII